MIVLDGSPYAAVGLSISRDQLTLVAIDLAGEQLLSWRRAFAGGPPAKVLASVAALAKRALARLHDEGRQVLGLTVGVVGLVDSDGVVQLAPTLGWRDVPVRKTLVRALGDPSYPVVVHNDANLAVLAEHRYGPYAGAANLVYLAGGTGIGAGIIAGGQLLSGGLGYAGEIGHLQVDPSGPPCGCGRRGCLEAVASVGALVRRLGDAVTDSDELAPEVDEVIRRARAQEPAVLAALRDLGRHLGHGVGVLANLLNPEVVILGGYYVPLAPWVIPAAQDELNARAVAPDAGGLRLVASALGHDAPATGGAAQVLESADTSQLPLLIG
jgi:predicted NBD/HSP70 family sugar kinase